MAFVFDESDVLANRLGRLSDDQRQRIGAVASVNARRTPVMLAIVIVLFIGAGVAAVATSGGDPAVIGAVAAGLVVPAIVIGWAIRRARRMSRAMSAPVVTTSTGVPDVSVSMTPGYWDVRIGQLRFTFDGGTAILVDAERPLRAYSTDIGLGSPVMLSAEYAD
jgi:hypothetical protein